MKTFSSEQISAMAQRYRATFINCLSGFKSANLIGSQNLAAAHNLCVVNSVFHVGAHPPLLGMITRPHTVRRDTLENIRATGSYTINHIHQGMVGAAHQTSAKYPQADSEFERTGLTPWFSASHPAPFVQESRLRLGMQLQEIQRLAVNQTELVIGQITEVHIDECAIEPDGFVDLAQLDEVTICGLDGYYLAQRLDRYEYAQPEQPPQIKPK